MKKNLLKFVILSIFCFSLYGQVTTNDAGMTVPEDIIRTDKVEIKYLEPII